MKTNRVHATSWPLLLAGAGAVAASVLLCDCLTAAGVGYFAYSSVDQSPRDPFTPEVVAAIRPRLRYHKVIVQPFGADDSVEDAWQDPVSECRGAAVAFLGEKRLFASVEEAMDALDARPSDADTLLVDANVTSTRLVSTTGRALGGIFAGSSDFTLIVRATNAQGRSIRRLVSGSNIRERTWINPSDGDRGLPAATGILVADTIVRMAQAFLAN